MVWRSSDGWGRDLERKPVATAIKAAVIVILVAFALTALVGGVATNFSYWWGQNGATRDKNSTSNFESAQVQFHRDYNAVATDRVKIQQAQADLGAWQQAHPNYQGNGTPFDPLAEQESEKQGVVTGLRLGCLNEVTDYDTASQAYLSADWKDAGLPASLDPATACDPTKPLPSG
jgi:hypothetical protein